MPRTLTALAVIALAVGACGGGGAAATTAPTAAPATQAPATAETTEAPADTGSGSGSGGGSGSSQSADSLKALAQQLTPPSSTETGHLEANGVYQLYLTTTQSLDQLKAFYDAKAASIPIKEYTKVDASGSLYIGGSDPVIGIIAAPDPANAGQFSVIISVGS
jgi:hypothetical protein